MPLENKRGSWWIAGRIALVAAAFAVLAAVFFVPQRIADLGLGFVRLVRIGRARPIQFFGVRTMFASGRERTGRYGVRDRRSGRLMRCALGGSRQ